MQFKPYFILFYPLTTGTPTVFPFNQRETVWFFMIGYLGKQTNLVDINSTCFFHLFPIGVSSFLVNFSHFLPVKPTISPVPGLHRHGVRGGHERALRAALPDRAQGRVRARPEALLVCGLCLAEMDRWDTVGICGIGGVLTWIRFIRWGGDDNRLYIYIWLIIYKIDLR